jgi:hypothetical protein
MPTFTPQSEDQLKRSFEPLPEGDYDFEVLAAEEALSSKGSDMIKLKVKAFSGSVETNIFDYLVFTEKSQWKIYSFCKAVGLAEKFKAGEITDLDCQGRTGRAHIKVDKSEGYDDKNVIGYYIEAKAPGKPLSKDEKDDDIPF